MTQYLVLRPGLSTRWKWDENRWCQQIILIYGHLIKSQICWYYFCQLPQLMFGIGYIIQVHFGVTSLDISSMALCFIIHHLDFISSFFRVQVHSFDHSTYYKPRICFPLFCLYHQVIQLKMISPTTQTLFIHLHVSATLSFVQTRGLNRRESGEGNKRYSKLISL